ncbi:hypothetical protein [Streptomyces sp. NPDC005301]|uniref:hypothetical protein n=1 Tax=unclassified Streptomyces TaxID=2593676 RepID=UPI0033ABBF65
MSASGTLAGRLRYSLAAHDRAVREGLLPTWRQLGTAVPRYLRRSYHPPRECSPRAEEEHLARSPAAARAIGRAALA